MKARGIARVGRRSLLGGWLGAVLASAAGLSASLPRQVRADETAPTATAPSPKRTLPDYEGRVPPPTTAGDVLLWIPRVVFSPVYFTTEFLIRRPLGAAITAAERGNLPTALYNFFAFGPDHKAGFAPLLFLDFGFHPSAGVYLFWDDAFFKGDDLRIHASTWGLDWVAGTFTQRLRLSHAKTLTLTVGGIRRPDHVYYGLGPNTLQSAQSRYGEDKVDVAWTLNVPLWRSSRIETALGVRTASFYDGHFGGDPTVTQQVRAGVFALPPGFENRYTAQGSHLLAAFDTRRPYPFPGSGVRVEAQALLGSNLNESPASAWLRIDDGAAAYLDLDGHRRVVSLGVETSFSNPLGSGTIPFTELVSLGGDFAPMPGFYPGRLVDRSAAVATLRYRWPIGPELSGSMQAAVGNVFGVDLDGFEPKLLRLSGALGIQSDMSADSDIHFLIGFGTETFDHGGQVDSFRLAFGTSRF